MKVVYLNYLYDLKESSMGASVHVKELTRTLQECGHQVKTYYLNRFSSVEASVQSKYRKFFKEKLWRYFNQVNAIIANGRYFFKEWKIISKEKPDILLVRYNLLNFSFAIAALLKRIPIVLEVNAPMAYENRLYSKHIIKLSVIAEWIERLILHASDKVYVVSQELKNYYINKQISASKIHVIPNGVDEKRILPNHENPQLISRYSLKNKTVIGFIGSFHYWHGIEMLIDFIDMLHSRFKGIVFLMVGEGPLKSKMIERFKSKQFKDSIIFSDYIPHESIPGYLSVMDIVLAPYPPISFFYYSPLKIFEYMAAGKCVLASRIGQIKEIINDGENGMLFEPNNLSEMIEKASKVINDNCLRGKISLGARKTIEEKFTWNHTARQISHLFHELRKKMN